MAQDAAYSPPIRLGLDPIRSVCDALGQPQLASQSVLVAGTNGKGSTAFFLESIGRVAGLKTGLFHSPGLGADHGQIRIDGEAIDEAVYAMLLEEVSRVAGEVGEALTPFELKTAVGFLAFARADVDLAIVEVGLGGARDATNIAEPLASVLTTVDFDHMDLLGASLASIATEKAGIFRRRRPAVLGFLRGPALRAARQEADTIGARQIAVRSHIRVFEEKADGSLDLDTQRSRYRLDVPLPGLHQKRNAALAVLTAEALRSRFPSLDQESIQRGIAVAKLPGRLEWIHRNERRFLLDVAHNPGAARVLANYLEGLDERPDLLFGAFADKDFSGMLEILRPHVGRLLLTAIENPRSWDPAAAAPAFGGEIVKSPASGLALAQPRIPLLISGSLRLVGDMRRLLLEPATSYAAGG